MSFIKKTVHLFLLMAALGLLRLYQRLFPPIKYFLFGSDPVCRFYPSCSCYAQDAYRFHGLIKGTLFTIFRLLRCHPFHSGGFDPVPGHFLIKTFWKASTQNNQ